MGDRPQNGRDLPFATYTKMFWARSKYEIIYIMWLSRIKRPPEKDHYLLDSEITFSAL